MTLKIDHSATLQRQLGEKDARIARLTAPVSDDEWLNLCAGDHVELTDVTREDVARLIAARASAKPERES